MPLGPKATTSASPARPPLSIATPGLFTARGAGHGSNGGAALRLSVEHGSVSWESEVLAAHHRMASEPIYRPDDPHSRNPAWAAAHIAFHAKLIEACGSLVLLDICHRLSDARVWNARRVRA